MLTLSAMALQALEWTKEHVLPWMLKGTSGVIGWLTRKHYARQQEELLIITAAGLPAASCVRMHLLCVPGTKHGLFIRDGKGTASFALRITMVAPFGVRPHSVSATFVVRRADEGTQNAGSSRAEPVRIPDHKITHRFMGPGDHYDFEVDREVDFKHDVPPNGTTMVIWFHATVTLLGPWHHEYGNASHEQSIFVDCRHAL